MNIYIYYLYCLNYILLVLLWRWWKSCLVLKKSCLVLKKSCFVLKKSCWICSKSVVTPLTLAYTIHQYPTIRTQYFICFAVLWIKGRGISWVYLLHLKLKKPYDTVYSSVWQKPTHPSIPSWIIWRGTSTNVRSDILWTVRVGADNYDGLHWANTWNARVVFGTKNKHEEHVVTILVIINVLFHAYNQRSFLCL